MKWFPAGNQTFGGIKHVFPPRRLTRRLQQVIGIAEGAFTPVAEGFEHPVRYFGVGGEIADVRPRYIQRIGERLLGGKHAAIDVLR